MTEQLAETHVYLIVSGPTSMRCEAGDRLHVSIAYLEEHGTPISGVFSGLSEPGAASLAVVRLGFDPLSIDYYLCLGIGVIGGDHRIGLGDQDFRKSKLHGLEELTGMLHALVVSSAGQLLVVEPYMLTRLFQHMEIPETTIPVTPGSLYRMTVVDGEIDRVEQLVR